jgi:hypothetical protein
VAGVELVGLVPLVIPEGVSLDLDPLVNAGLDVVVDFDPPVKPELLGGDDFDPPPKPELLEEKLDLEPPEKPPLLPPLASTKLAPITNKLIMIANHRDFLNMLNSFH